ncbi:MAG TPA: LysM peptidoglycan-binding domain-containing protein [Polyangia bacterium]|jgi:hypothetical protein|nr:LysM peptidoglycan-binding domain-containing protein [Polyangia bacterium]
MRRSAVILWCSLVPLAAGAQETSDLMKPVQNQIERQNELQQPGWRAVTGQTLRSPSAPPGQGQGTGGAPAGGPEGAAQEGAAEGGEADGRGHGAAVLDEDARGAPRVQIEAGEGLGQPTRVPGGRQLLHQIQPGDTLSGIAQRYYGTPDAWPRLWSLNPEITNPHWIYPGATLRLAPPTAAPAPTRSAPAPAAAPTPRPSVTVSRPRPPAGVLLLRNAFVEGGELAAAGKIVGSADEKSMLVTLDEVYVEFRKPRGAQAPIRPSPGQRYTVYRERSEVKHPKTRQPLGSLVEILGEVEVLDAPASGPCKVRIMEALEPIERGDRIGPLHRHVKLVEPTQARVDLDGVVVATLRPMELLGKDMLVFIDRGRKDGVVEGNRFQVVRRGDPNRLPLGAGGLNDERFPREVVAEILIVEVREQTAGGVVVSALKETALGDRVELRREP